MSASTVSSTHYDDVTVVEEVEFSTIEQVEEVEKSEDVSTLEESVVIGTSETVSAMSSR